MAHTTALTRPQGHVFLNPTKRDYTGLCLSCGEVSIAQPGLLCNECGELRAWFDAARFGWTLTPLPGPEKR